MSGPGRSCPLAYRYRPEDLAGPVAFGCATLYVVGGLYGNAWALDAVRERAAAEPAPPEIVFNGDFHYLDADPAAFRTVADGVAAHHVTLGNVEYALTTDGAEVGCGCDYPDYVGDSVVTASNAVVERLRTTAADHPEHLARLADLPRHLDVAVGGRRVAIVHGDPESLAGWKLALEAVEPGDEDVRARTGFSGMPTGTDQVLDWFGRADADVICCTHTGLPYAQDHHGGGRRHLVANNGSAGLPNFAGRRHGVITRLSTGTEPPADSLYGLDMDGLRFDALPVRFDTERWTADFLATWPPGSPGHQGYHARIADSTWLRIEQAARGGVQITGG
ncbi:metallophosphoesterase family protein [Pseudonocardia bannensis]|uniref:Metallophosphoesterase family protein n=1 Tax=Pseudonocardia bannensis TaxID=630973 RepID=A0A848DBY2_9PSEU|nr:metallophosphoesterase family protein [Pseudonocardia bannensis]NMH90031.1 metallophosphoesterase family protein [Pseudonocardia bannensis]